MTIMKAHVRRFLDRRLVRALCATYQWLVQEVMKYYAEGIGWELIRRILRGKVADLSHIERRALEVLVCNGIWWGHRRWLLGYAGQSTCRLCHSEVGDARHTLHGRCEAMHFDLTCRAALGKARSLPNQACEAGLRPLAEMGLPPLTIQWRPRDEQHTEGDMPIVDIVNLYGDGSGYHQSSLKTSRASWAVVLMNDGNDGLPRNQTARAVARAEVPGWFRTVPRGEMLAIEFALSRVGSRMTYIGDCQSGIGACHDGVPSSLRSSRNVNADIWTRIGQLMDDKRDHVHFVKTRAHRSRASAELAWDDGVDNWHGNREADHYCKSLIRQPAMDDPEVKMASVATELAITTINFIGHNAGWFFRRAADACLQRLCANPNVAR